MRRYEDPVEVRRGPVGSTLDLGTDGGADAYTDAHRRQGAGAVPLARPALEGPGGARPLGRDRVVVELAGRPGGDRLREAESTVDEPEPVPRPLGDLLTERELWRVEAGRGRAVGGPDGETDTGGVFDLAFDWADGCWQLVGCMD